MSYFRKLISNINLGQVLPSHLHIRYGRQGDDGVFRGIQYHVADGDVENIYQIIPERYRQDFNTLVMSINRDVPPHTDSGILASINLYVAAGNCETVFYAPKADGKVVTEQIANQTNGAIFDINCLDAVSKFTAKDGEAYILDVTHPHGVFNLANIAVQQRAVVLQTRIHSYDRVCEMLLETGYLDQ